ncbi:MAG: uroporphyrinogen decarboxylase family protein [Candidatus Hodarchaeota archaeon]
MESRELVIRALKFKKPDRIPLHLATSPIDSDTVGGLIFPFRGWKLNRFQKRIGIKRAPTSYLLSRVKKGKHYLIDEFGSIWYNPGNETIGQVVNPRVVKKWEDIEKVRKRTIQMRNNKGRWWMTKLLFGLFGKKKFRVGSLDQFYFERLHMLRGFGNLLKDLKRNREKVKELAEVLADWYIWLVDQWAKQGTDGLFATDDWGTNHGPFISPKDFEDVFKPVYQKVTERIHDHGMYFLLHSCGNIYYLIPKLIESGVDCLQLDQPRMTGLKKLQEFGGKIAYMCVADISKIIPYKTPKEVEAEVLTMIKTLGKFNGGLLGTIYADLAAVNFPAKNMAANVRAYKRFGKYGEYPLN